MEVESVEAGDEEMEEDGGVAVASRPLALA